MEKRFDIELLAVRPKVLAVARRFFRASGVDADPEDVVQEVLLRLWEALRSGSAVNNPDAWAVTCAKNYCVSLWRRKKGVKTALSAQLASAESPSARMEEADAAATAIRALALLPEGTRYLLKLRARGLSLDEMAAITGRPKGSIKSSLSAARKELMKTLYK